MAKTYPTRPITQYNPILLSEYLLIYRSSLVYY